jgi:hypothetical protein
MGAARDEYLPRIHRDQKLRIGIIAAVSRCVHVERAAHLAVGGVYRRLRFSHLSAVTTRQESLRRLPPLFAELLDLEPCLISSIMSRIITIADQTVKGDDLIYIGEAFHRRCKVGRCGWLFN